MQGPARRSLLQAGTYLHKPGKVLQPQLAWQEVIRLHEQLQDVSPQLEGQVACTVLQ